ncbi:hypothetical protein NXW27_00445 [Phocaeicola dorei]|nr:hypothetical protein [Phocaeicola dorei]
MTKVQAFKAYLREPMYASIWTAKTRYCSVESRMNQERTLTAMLQTNLMSEEE